MIRSFGRPSAASVARVLVNVDMIASEEHDLGLPHQAQGPHGRVREAASVLINMFAGPTSSDTALRRENVRVHLIYRSNWYGEGGRS